MAIVITLGSDNRLVFEKPNGDKCTMKTPITAENKNDILQNKSLRNLMSVDTMNDINEIEKVIDITAFIKDHPFPLYEVVENLIKKRISSWSEYGELNHHHVSIIYNNIDDFKKVNKAAKAIARRGGLSALQASFYSILEILKHLVKKREDLEDIWYYVKDKLYRGFDGVAGWRN